MKAHRAYGLILALYGRAVQGDGTGLIGWGKTMYDPTCTFACRNVIRKQQLGCTPVDTTANHGTSHNPVATPPECFVEDPVFLKTMALCIDTYCPLSGDPSKGVIDDYWVSHLGTGTVGDYQFEPVMTYQDALSAARKDEASAARKDEASASDHSNSTAGNETSHNHAHKMLKTRQLSGAGSEDLVTFDVSSPLPITLGGSEPLNETSFVDPAEWQLQYNYLSDFETNETGHSTMTIIIAIVAIILPIPLSLVRYLPHLSKSRGWTYAQSMLINPSTFKSHHREPVAGAIVPTRGQTMYIFVISFLNLVLLLAPYVITQPQASFPSRDMQTLSIVGNRAGTMAMGNTVALFLFAARNNPVMLCVTDWSYGTYVLLHRWLGYWAVFHTVLHSFMLLANYVVQGTYWDEFARLYWSWGIVGTVAVCAMVPASILWVRQRFYELFLASHIVLALLFIIGYYYHIWYVYGYNWGYEIWAFIAGGIWGADRVLRLIRMAVHGSRTAIVTEVEDTDGEYVRIDVQGKYLKDGVAYLCFPTLGWRFWETHPLSVAYQSLGGDEDGSQPASPGISAEDPEKSTGATKTTVVAAGPATSSRHATTTFFARRRTGITKQLVSRVAAGSDPVQLRVLIDGPYDHSGRASSQIAQCNAVLCIAGGVGITACLPHLVSSGGVKDGKLFWSTRKPGLAAALAPTLASLPSSVSVATAVGERLALDSILEREMLGAKNEGSLAIVVCGPPGMADDVRKKVVSLARENPLCRPYVLLDEAFSW